MKVSNANNVDAINSTFVMNNVDTRTMSQMNNNNA